MTSLRGRLFAAIAASVALSLLLTLLVGGVLTRRQVERATLRDVSHQADLLAGRERIAIAPLIHLKEKAFKAYLARQDERVATPPLSRPSPYLSDDERRRLRAGESVDGTVEVDGTRYFFAARPVDRRAFVLLRPARLGSAAWKPYLQGLVLAALVGGALAALVSFLVARAIARPVARVAAASRSVAEQRSPEPLPEEGARELASLARSFNEMATRLDAARAAERTFLLSVSHELKTPLTAIRGYAEGLAEEAVAPAEAAETIAKEAARLERLVHDLLDLARLNRSEFSIHTAPIDLRDAALETIRRYESQAHTFGVTLEAELDGPAPALGDADRVVQVVSNLVENALRLTPRGGVVRVRTSGSSVEVEDTGPGLRAEELPHAFERFFLYSRYESERRVGTGLGLAIVKELVEGMGGTVEVRSDDGVTRFAFQLPETA
jgi:two-component system sensor histidine kinase BaeS